MAVNDPKWQEGEVKTFQSSGTTPTVRWHEGQPLMIHEYVAAGAEYDRAIEGILPAMTGSVVRTFRPKRAVGGVL